MVASAPCLKSHKRNSALASSGRAAALALFLFVAGCAGTSGPQRVWDASSISASGSYQVRLPEKNADGSSTAVGYVRRDQVVQYREMVQLTRAATQPVSTSDVPASRSIRRNIWGITFSGEEAEQVRVVAIGAGVSTSLRVGDIVESCESSGSGTAFMVVSTLDDLQYCQPQTLAKKWSAIDSYRLRARRLEGVLIATIQL